MKMLVFARRNLKEILRDPLTIVFSLGFPAVILLLLTAIQSNVPVSLFELPSLTPGVTVFGLSFLSLFSATLIAKDRESAFLQRLYATPLTAADFLFGYLLPLVPLSMAQSAVCYLLAFLLGLPFSVNVLWAVLSVAAVSLLFIGLGLLCGSALSVRQVGGVCGALLTNLTAWLSGVWFDLRLVGGAFEKVAYALPFVHAVEIERALVAGELQAVLPHCLWVLGYTAVLLSAATFLFLRQMKKQ